MKIVIESKEGEHSIIVEARPGAAHACGISCGESRSVLMSLEEIHRVIDALEIVENYVIKTTRRGPWLDPFPAWVCK